MSGQDALLWALTGPIGPAIKKMAGGYDKKPKMLEPQQVLAPKVGEDTELKPGQKANLINTSPQGVLETAQSARQTLLGG